MKTCSPRPIKNSVLLGSLTCHLLQYCAIPSHLLYSYAPYKSNSSGGSVRAGRPPYLPRYLNLFLSLVSFCCSQLQFSENHSLPVCAPARKHTRALVGQLCSTFNTYCSQLIQFKNTVVQYVWSERDVDYT